MKLVELVYTCKAEDDLDSIFDYIAENSAENALNYIDGMQSAIEKAMFALSVEKNNQIF